MSWFTKQVVTWVENTTEWWTGGATGIWDASGVTWDSLRTSWDSIQGSGGNDWFTDNTE